MGMKFLKVNWTGDVLVINGPATGRRYEYIPHRDQGLLHVDEADVPGLLAHMYSRGGGCVGCGGESGGVPQAMTRVHMFEV